jgi:hypothetical protein
MQQQQARLPDGSRVRRESHARFCESLGVRPPGATHLALTDRFEPVRVAPPHFILRAVGPSDRPRERAGLGSRRRLGPHRAW